MLEVVRKGKTENIEYRPYKKSGWHILVQHPEKEEKNIQYLWR
jgi:hypothetical protein